MSLIRIIKSRFTDLEISVTIDPKLLPEIHCKDKSNTQRVLLINLYKLIYAIGTIQTRRFAPSNRMKFIDKSDLLEKIYSNTKEFRVKINEIRYNGGSEVLTSISEDFGVGISVLIAEKLFNIKFSTIQRIYGNKKRPDWKCQTNDNKILVVESKGATNQNTSNRQESKAINQKAQEPGDIKVASLTVINEDKITQNRFLDPPINSDNLNWKMKNKILRAGHYSSVFSFLGHSILSKYYSQMRRRLLNSLTQSEQIEKDALYFKLRDNYPNVRFENNTYTGTFYKIEKEKYLFVGVDKTLLSYQGFLRFEDYDKEIEETLNGNHYMLFKDGILIIEINKIENFNVAPNKIKNYQDNITISDVDAMTELSFEKYIKYVLVKNGFKVQKEKNIKYLSPDIIGLKDNKEYVFELYLSKKKKIKRINFEKLHFYLKSKKEEIYKIVLITNAEIDVSKIYIGNNDVVIIDRKKLREIFKNKKKMLDFIK